MSGLTAIKKSGITGITMARLNNRQLQIPGGYKFYQPETKFQTRPGSFNNVVDQVIMMRMANAALTRAKQWATDFNSVSNEVDAFNSAICERMGWTTYISQVASSAAPSPKFKALSPQSESQISAAAGVVKKVWQGVKSLNEWLETKEPAVPSEQAEARAATCAACVLNGKGGLEEWFTKPAAMAIKQQFAMLSERKLSTTLDGKLNVCTACLCPLKLKVHTPLKYISNHMGDETRRALDPVCWILKEEADSKVQKSTMVDSNPA